MHPFHPSGSNASGYDKKQKNVPVREGYKTIFKKMKEFVTAISVRAYMAISVLLASFGEKN